MSTIRDDFKDLIDTLSERQILALWRVAASMRPSETLTPEEARLATLIWGSCLDPNT